MGQEHGSVIKKMLMCKRYFYFTLLLTVAVERGEEQPTEWCSVY